ncbi:MAG TPA: response regulator [Bryobacteraceae bacterium]|nr:response regulator [Bryobacteraceae bacterium]
MPNKLIDILLVEDSPADIRLAQETLKYYKMQNVLHIVRDGEAVLQFLRQQGKFADAPVPDLILLDIALPKVDGIEVLAELKKDDVLRDIPVAILTASVMDERMLKHFDISADCCIQKPLTLESYLNAVRCFPQMGLSIVKLVNA